MIIDHSWTLFLDRDGVINERIMDGYVRTWEQFSVLPGVYEAIKTFNKIFQHTFIVTNQAGVGKGLMSNEDLNEIHKRFMADITQHGAHIDGIYCCTALPDEAGNCRKPAPAMAMKARQDFPDIDFERAFMVGDTRVDLLFGRNIGAYTVLIVHPTDEQKNIEDDLVDLRFGSLLEFARFLLASQN